MQRWFFADSVEVCEAGPEYEAPPTPTPTAASVESLTPPAEIERCWKFCASAYERLLPNERLAVTGSCKALGEWQLSRCVIMTRCEGCPTMWKSISMLVPRNSPTEYRYMVLAEDTKGEKFIVRRWETHLQPRVLLPQQVGMSNEVPDCEDVFGEWDAERKVDRGWLTCETYVQFMFVKAPFMWKPRISPAREIYVKVTPMKINAPSNCIGDSLVGKPILTSPLIDGLSVDEAWEEPGAHLSTAFALSEVAVLKDGETKLRAQPQWGVAAAPEDVVVFHLTIGEFEQTAYLIDLYTYSHKAAADEPPYHYGYCYVLPQEQLKQSRGRFKATVSCASRHRPLGTIQVDYLIVRPITPPLDPPLNMHTSFIRHWKSGLRGVEMGHRGCGLTYMDYEGVVRENTIYSLKKAAAASADVLEFDVHLSRDGVPFLYHDYHLHVTPKRAEPFCKQDFDSVPVCEFSMAELQSLRVSSFGEGYFWEDEAECPLVGEERERQPFPTLEEVFDQIDSDLGFNIEVKWSQLQENNTMQDEFKHRLDPNAYVDAILEVVFRKPQSRPIFMQSFDVDICIMLRFKQNVYPIMLLTLGNKPIDTPRFADLRCQTFEAAIYTAQTFELLGLVTPSREFLEDPAQMLRIRNAHLVLFCYGAEIKTMESIQLLKDLGVSAVIFDRITNLSGNSRPRSIFSVRELAIEYKSWPQSIQGKKRRSKTRWDLMEGRHDSN